MSGETSPVIETTKFQVVAKPRKALPSNEDGAGKPKAREKPTPPARPVPGELDLLIKQREELTKRIRVLRRPPREEADSFELCKPKLQHALEVGSVGVFYHNRGEKWDAADFTANEIRKLKELGLVSIQDRQVTVTRPVLWLTGEALKRLGADRPDGEV